MRPFAGAVEALHSLERRGHRLGLLTKGSAEFRREKLARFELKPLVDIILIEGELGMANRIGGGLAPATARDTRWGDTPTERARRVAAR